MAWRNDRCSRRSPTDLVDYRPRVPCLSRPVLEVLPQFRGDMKHGSNGYQRDRFEGVRTEPGPDPPIVVMGPLTRPRCWREIRGSSSSVAKTQGSAARANAAYAAMCRVTSDDLDLGMRDWLDKQTRVDKFLLQAPQVERPTVQAVLPRRPKIWPA